LIIHFPFLNFSSLSEQSAVSLQRQAEKVDDHHYRSTVDKHLIVKSLGILALEYMTRMQ